MSNQITLFRILLQFLTILFSYKLRKCTGLLPEKRKYVNIVCHLLNPYFLTDLLTMPFNRLLWAQQQHFPQPNIICNCKSSWQPHKQQRETAATTTNKRTVYIVGKYSIHCKQSKKSTKFVDIIQKGFIPLFYLSPDILKI